MHLPPHHEPKLTIPDNLLSLPACSYAGRLLELLEHNQVVIVEGETGSGKSSILLAELAQRYQVYAAVPRFLVAKGLAGFTASLFGEMPGGMVGFETMSEAIRSDASKLVYATDGYELMTVMHGRLQRDCVLVVDEFHERNLNQDVLVAYARRLIEHGARFKVVIMSATIDVRALSNYFFNAPILSIPGRLYDVTMLKPENTWENSILKLLEIARNSATKGDPFGVLAFVPGKRKLHQVIRNLRDLGVSEMILPCHAELSAREQALVLEKYNEPFVVVSTPVCESGITPPSIRAVMDSGEVNEIWVVDGVEGLHCKWIPVASMRQRIGRAGRVAPGWAVTHLPKNRYSYDRREYVTPEVQRRLLETMWLKVMSATGLDMLELHFLDNIPREEIKQAKRRLYALGCIDHKYAVTKVGEEASSLPMSVQLARAVIHAIELGVEYPAVMAAAVVEAGGVGTRANTAWQSRFCPNETESDILAQLITFQDVLRMQDEAEEAEQRQKVDEELVELGIDLKAVKRARIILQKSTQRLRVSEEYVDIKPVRDSLIRAFQVGLAGHVFMNVGNGLYRNAEETPRRLISASVVGDSKYIVGIPVDLKVVTPDDDEKPIHLITWATAIPEYLAPGWLNKLRRIKDRVEQRTTEGRRKKRKNNSNRVPPRQSFRRG